MCSCAAVSICLVLSGPIPFKRGVRPRSGTLVLFCRNMRVCELVRPGVRGELLLRLLDPSSEFRLADHPDGDRHEGMILAAQLGALTVVPAFLGGLEPRLVQASRNGVDLDAE